MPIDYKLHKELGLCTRCNKPVSWGLLCADHVILAKKYKHTKRLKKIANGICVDCTELATSGNEYCEKHSAHRRKRKQTTTINRRNKKLCVDCGKPVLDGYKLCEYHHFRDYDRCVKKNYTRMINGICYSCSQPAVANLHFCQEHLDRFKIYTSNRQNEFLSQGKCRCGRDLDNNSKTCMVCADKKLLCSKKEK